MGATVSIEIRYRDPTGSARKSTADGLKGIGDSADKAKDQLSAFGKVTEGALERVGHIAVDALKDAGQMLFAFAKDAVKGAGDYEQSMNLIAAQSDEAASRIGEFKDAAKALGADLELPATSAKTAGDAMLELAKAGLDVDTVLRDAKGTLQLAAAGNLEAGQAAEYAAAAVNTFGKEAVTAAMAADQYAAVAANSAAEVSDVADANKMAASVYASMQSPVVGATEAFADLNTALALLAQAGIKGSDAGTSLKQSLLQLAAPSDKAKGLMKDLADRVGESGDLAYDASGKMRSYKDILRITADATADMTQEQKNYYISTIFGADATRSILALVKAGPDAWDKMRGSVTRAGAAHDLAAAQMQGLNGAAAGLSSQIETLALEALEPLLPVMTAGIQQASAFAASFSGQLGPAVSGAITLVGDIAAVAQTAFVPAIVAATAVTIAYAVSAVAPMLVNVPAMTAVLIYQTQAWIANAAAVAAAAAPLVAIGGAFALAAYLVQDAQTKIRDNTNALLEALPVWQQSNSVIKDYAGQTGEARAALAPYAATIDQLRAQIVDETNALQNNIQSRRISAEQVQLARDHIAQLETALGQTTTAYTAQEQAIVRAAAATQTGTARLSEMEAGEADIVVQTELTEKEFEKLQKQIEKTFEDGAKAVGDYVNTELAFIQDLEKYHQDHDAKTLAQQAATYALESAAQKAHLGQMLSDYTLEQVQMGNINKETGEKILAQIEHQFGVQKDLSAATFLAMTSDIDRAANEGGAALDQLGQHLGDVTDNAVETKAKMDALAHKYEAELIQNFKDGKIDADELRRALQDIPSRVESEVVVTTVKKTVYVSGEGDHEERGGMSGTRAGGGPVLSGQPYLVGERGPEMFVPDSGGRIIPNGQTTQMMGGSTYVLNYYGQAGNAPQEDVAQAMKVHQLLYG